MICHNTQIFFIRYVIHLSTAKNSIVFTQIKISNIFIISQIVLDCRNGYVRHFSSIFSQNSQIALDCGWYPLLKHTSVNTSVKCRARVEKGQGLGPLWKICASQRTHTPQWEHANVGLKGGISCKGTKPVIKHKGQSWVIPVLARNRIIW